MRYSSFFGWIQMLTVLEVLIMIGTELVAQLLQKTRNLDGCGIYWSPERMPFD